jgi:hypothetical protein
MEEVRKHLEAEQEKADNAYWEVYGRLEDKQRELNQLMADVQWMKNDMLKYDSERKYYQKLLNDLNNTTTHE